MYIIYFIIVYGFIIENVLQMSITQPLEKPCWIEFMLYAGATAMTTSFFANAYYDAKAKRVEGKDNMKHDLFC